MEVELVPGLLAFWRPTRRATCARLAAEATASSLEQLVAAAAYYSDPLHPDPPTVAAALAGLRQQTAPEARVAIVEAWHAGGRPAAVEGVLSGHGWAEGVSGAARIWLACLLHLPDRLADLAPADLPQWRLAGGDPGAAAAAWAALPFFRDPEVREALCQEVLADPKGPLAAAVIAAGFLPRSRSDRLKFWLLAGEADRVLAGDPDCAESARIYAASPPPVQARIRSVLQASGDLRWREVFRSRSRAGTLIPEEVETLIALARQNAAWADLWALVPQGSLRQAATLLLALAGSGWMPSRQEERDLYEEAVGLARTVAADRWSFATLGGHQGRIRALAVTPDGRTLASGGEDGVLRLWNLPDGRELAAPEGHGAAVAHLAVSPDGRLLASAGWDHTVRLWALPDGSPLATLTHGGSVTALAVTPDGRLLAAGSEDDTVHLWELPSGRSLGMLADFTQRSHWARPVMALAPTPDGRILAAGMDDGSVRLWGLAEGRSLAKLAGHRRSVMALAVTPDGRILASGSDDGRVRLWGLPEGKGLATLTGHKGWVRALVITPDGKILASGGADRTVRLWSLPAGRLLATLTGQGAGIVRLAVTPDGGVLTGVGWDHGVRAWRLPAGEPLGAWTDPTDGLSAVAVTPDGRFLAAGGRDGTVQISALLHGHDFARWGPDRIRPPLEQAPPSVERLSQFLLRYRFRHAVMLGRETIPVPGPAAVVLLATDAATGAPPFS